MRLMLPLNRGQNNKRCKGDLGSDMLPLILINKANRCALTCL